MRTILSGIVCSWSDGSGRGKFPEEEDLPDRDQLWTVSLPLNETKESQMKEILYIQAGTFPNFVGTHFWNTQDSYFQYFFADDADEADEPEIDHYVSFREGLSPKVRLKSLARSRKPESLMMAAQSGCFHILSPALGFG